MSNYRQVARIYSAPRPHWVGNGFLVHPMFNHMVGDKRTDPFLMLDYAAPRHFEPHQVANQARGVGEHPHKGFETITIAYQGEVAHRDSSGGGGVIKTGDVQWMTAGNGILHEEFHSPAFSERGGNFEMVQLWVNLPKKHKHVAPRYQHLTNEHIPLVNLYNDDGKIAGTARLIAGQWLGHQQQLQGLGNTFTPINLWDISLEAGQATEIDIPKNHNVMVLVMRGTVIINANATHSVGEKQLVMFAPETEQEGVDTIRIAATEQETLILLMSGEPINEPIVGYGPFVMTSELEIRQAIHEFNSGKFGELAAE